MVRVPMPPSRRAKIFSMFDALKGLKEALAAQGYATHEVNLCDVSILLTRDAVIPQGCTLLIAGSYTIQ